MASQGARSLGRATGRHRGLYPARYVDVVVRNRENYYFSATLVHVFSFGYCPTTVHGISSVFLLEALLEYSTDSPELSSKPAGSADGRANGSYITIIYSGTLSSRSKRHGTPNFRHMHSFNAPSFLLCFPMQSDQRDRAGHGGHERVNHGVDGRVVFLVGRGRP